MKNAIIIHGGAEDWEYYSDEYPSLSNSHWIPWLQKQLLMKDIPTQTPEMPYPAKDNYDGWKRELERYDITNETTLIGHSSGGGFILRWLAESGRTTGYVILVAPWIDYENERGDFLKFDVDPAVATRAKRIDVLVSDDENNEGVIRAVKETVAALPDAKLHELSGMGHFTMNDMGTAQFPKLLTIILQAGE